MRLVLGAWRLVIRWAGAERRVRALRACLCKVQARRLRTHLRHRREGFWQLAWYALLSWRHLLDSLGRSTAAAQALNLAVRASARRGWDDACLCRGVLWHWQHSLESLGGATPTPSCSFPAGSPSARRGELQPRARRSAQVSAAPAGATSLWEVDLSALLLALFGAWRGMAAAALGERWRQEADTERAEAAVAWSQVADLQVKAAAEAALRARAQAQAEGLRRRLREQASAVAAAAAEVARTRAFAAWAANVAIQRAEKAHARAPLRQSKAPARALGVVRDMERAELAGLLAGAMHGWCAQVQASQLERWIAVIQAQQAVSSAATLHRRVDAPDATATARQLLGAY